MNCLFVCVLVELLAAQPQLRLQQQQQQQQQDELPSASVGWLAGWLLFTISTVVCR
jgi:hypothetical protein